MKPWKRDETLEIWKRDETLETLDVKKNQLRKKGLRPNGATKDDLLGNAGATKDDLLGNAGCQECQN